MIMHQLQTQNIQLPDTLDDLSKFVLVGREKLNAVRAEIRAIDKVGLAKEVHEQKLAEAQDIADAVLDAEVKIGELTSRMETSQGQRSDLQLTDTDVPKSKAKQLEDIGITEKQKQRYETLAKHPETVEKAKADARAEGRIVTRQDVLNRVVIPKAKNPSIKETVQTAIQEHKEFKESKQNAIVSIDDAIKDKENAEIATLDTKIRIEKVLQAIGTLSIITDDELKEMSKGLKTMDKSLYANSIREKIRILVHISNFLI